MPCSGEDGEPREPPELTLRFTPGLIRQTRLLDPSAQLGRSAVVLLISGGQHFKRRAVLVRGELRS